MATTQPFNDSSTSHERLDKTEGIKAFENEGGGQGRQRADGSRSEFRQDAELALQSAKDTLGNLRDMAGDARDSARKGMTDAAGAMKDAVVHNPWTSVGIAAGVGLLIGLLVGRARG